MRVSKDSFNQTSYKPERGASAVKRIKSRMRSKMKNDFLNFLLHISINGPPANSKEADQLLERVCNAYANEKYKKIPQVYTKLYQASFMISNFTEEEFSVEDDNLSDVEVV